MFRFALILEPLLRRREQLEATKRERQFLRDIEDEILWIHEKIPQAESTDYGSSLPSVQMLLKKLRSLDNEINNHELHMKRVVDAGLLLVEGRHPQSREYQRGINKLKEDWGKLREGVERRKNLLEKSEAAKQVSVTSDSAVWLSGARHPGFVLDIVRL